MKKIKIKNKTLLMICVVIISLISLSTIAYFISQDKVTNIINTGDVDITVNEDFNKPDDWDGGLYPKVVSVTNNTDTPTLIRVSITPRWENEDGKPYLGDTSIVELGMKNTIDRTKPLEQLLEEPGWVNGNDGYYYYYNTIVKRNPSITDISKDEGATTKNLLELVKLNISDDLKNVYKDKNLKIDVKAEAVQATEKAYVSSWISVKDDKVIKDMLDRLCVR